MPVHKIFVGGGGDHWFSGIVEDYAREYALANPGYICRYFNWTEGSDLESLLKSIGQDADVTVVGHSYGGDTAFSAIRTGRPVNTLISIDPVAAFQLPWTVIRGRCYRWLNVRAEPSRDHRTSDDAIAWLGGKYSRPPGRGQLGAPDYSVIVDATHGAFRVMMRAEVDGVSGRSLLGGANVR